MRIEHNTIQYDGDIARKDLGGYKADTYAFAAKTFSRVFQYALFGGRSFFDWPLSPNPNIRAEREWLYQAVMRERAAEIGNSIDGVRLNVVDFHKLDGTSIEMQRLIGYTSVSELLKNPDRVADRAQLGHAIKAYGEWTALLCNTGVVPECNHCGNIMLKDSDYRDMVVIDFENYSGPIQTIYEEDSEQLMDKHAMLDQPADPITSLALDIGILSGLKIPQDQKLFYTEHFLKGFHQLYEGPMDHLPNLLKDKRVMLIGMVRSFMYDLTHISEVGKINPSITFLTKDYGMLTRLVEDYLIDMESLIPLDQNLATQAA
jgi:hypothetical protein